MRASTKGLLVSAFVLTLSGAAYAQGAGGAGGGICGQAHSRAKPVPVTQAWLPTVVGAATSRGDGANNDLSPPWPGRGFTATRNRQRARDRPDGRVGDRALPAGHPQAGGQECRRRAGFENPAGIFAGCGGGAPGRSPRGPFAHRSGAEGGQRGAGIWSVTANSVKRFLSPSCFPR